MRGGEEGWRRERSQGGRALRLRGRVLASAQGGAAGKVGRGAGEDLGDREGACPGRGAPVCAAVFESRAPAGVCAPRSRRGMQSPRRSVGAVGLANCGPAPLSTPIPPRSTLTHTLWPPGPEDLI